MGDGGCKPLEHFHASLNHENALLFCFVAVPNGKPLQTFPGTAFLMRSLGDILYNFHWIVPGEAARAAQAWAGGLKAFLKKRGIRAIINLRGRNDDLSWWQGETEAVRGLGGRHFDAMLDSRKLPTSIMLTELMDAFDAAPRPFLLKCSGGQDRTSFAAALYVIHRQGWDAYNAAAAQYARFPYLHFPKKHQRWLRAFLDFAREDSKGAPIKDWIATDYQPERLKSWLDARGLDQTYAGIFSVPTRSPFQW
jgi:protein tyrosine/serine phosphatase